MFNLTITFLRDGLLALRAAHQATAEPSQSINYKETP